MENSPEETKKWRDQFVETIWKAQLDAGMKVCPECGGDGELEYERPVVDWMNGGYLEGYMDVCYNCSGDGFVEDEDEDSD